MYRCPSKKAVRKSNVQKVAVSTQRTIGFVGQNLFRQYLAQLDAFLVEAVQIPCKALKHDHCP